jgi:Spy/CpxP family protein refolding chaperone
MNTKWSRFVVIPALAGGMLLAATPEVSTQPNTPAPQHQRWQRRSAWIANYLNMTDAQKAQAKAEFQAARASMQPVRQQLSQLRQQMMQAVKANDTAQIQQLSAQEGSLRGQLLAAHSEVLAKVYSNLTPAQRAKADQLPAHFRQMRERRMQNRQNGSNS